MRRIGGEKWRKKVRHKKKSKQKSGEKKKMILKTTINILTD